MGDKQGGLSLTDGIFVDHDRLYVSTFRVDLGEEHADLKLDLFETLVYGPAARAGDHMLYTVEEHARTGHDEMLASYGYRKTGLRRWKFFRYLEFTGKGMVNVSRRPTSRKSVWIMTSFWAFAMLCAATGVVTYSGGWSVWSNLIIGSLDAYMLYQCILGLLWSYNIPRQGRRHRA